MRVLEDLAVLNRTQWATFLATWLGWTLDAFDFFLMTFMLGAIEREFHAPPGAGALAIGVTLMARPFGAYFFGWLADKFGRPPLPVRVHSPGHIAATDEQAKAEFWPRWRELIALVAAERGFAIPTKESFDAETGPHGALYVGSPETVAQKIATNLRALDATRFDLKYGMPGLTHDQLMTNIELYGREVIPRVRDLLS